MLLLMLVPLLGLRVDDGGPVPPYGVPLRIHATREGPMVEICSTVNLTAAPTLAPFFDNLVEYSGCKQAGADARGISLDVLVAKLAQETPTELWATPAGLIVHAMRSGSTAMANMVGSHPNVVVLKEPQAITDVLLAAMPSGDDVAGTDDGGALRGRTSEQQMMALKALTQLFFRSAASQRLSTALRRGFSRNAAQVHAADTKIVIKLATAGTAFHSSLALLRAAFPTTPVVYLVREPVASLASLLAATDRTELLSAPCLRWRGRRAAYHLPTLLECAGVSDPLELTAERYCAAHLAALHQSMLGQIEADRDTGKARTPLSLIVDHSALHESVERDVLSHFGLATSRRSLQAILAAGLLDAKNASSQTRGYASRTASPATRRWATAYAARTYARVRAAGRESAASAALLSAASLAARAAKANQSAGEGFYIHSGGIRGFRPRATCADSDELDEPRMEQVAELGMKHFMAGALFAAEACWLRSLEVGGSDSSRASVLRNLASLEDLLERKTGSAFPPG
jgi:hypothetical protein